MQIIKTSKNIPLEEGDLLFTQSIDDNFAKAIIACTAADQKSNFNHVGIACFENKTWYVIESISEGVCKTPLTQFGSKHSLIEVARLKPQYQEIIPSAIQSIKKQLGKPYDVYYSRGNLAFYCSELVQKFYVYNNQAIFPLIKMSFKCKQSGNYLPYWAEHFAKLNQPIPEGELGSNPNYLSKSEKIDMLGKLMLE